MTAKQAYVLVREVLRVACKQNAIEEVKDALLTCLRTLDDIIDYQASDQ